MKNAIIFTQAKDNNKAVVANKYVAHALYTQNKAIVEALGGTLVKGVGGFRAEFKTAKNAKAFITQAICEMSAKEYTKARKTEPKAKVVAPATAKGKAKTNDLVAVTLADGTKLMVKKSDLIPADVPTKKGKGKVATKPTTAPNAKVKATKTEAPRKAKGNATLTDAQKKALDIAKMSILNRAASAYSIANGGAPTNFDALGKSEKELAKYIPNAKAGMLKSKKWAKAVEMGITENMLG